MRGRLCLIKTLFFTQAFKQWVSIINRNMPEKKVILVDENDKELGFCDKLEAHQKGLLHRAFSIFIFNDKNELLLQKRALDKYHSGGLWANTCCSHPQPGENITTSAHQRLKEETGIEASLTKAFTFIYKSDVGSGLTEYELDHIFFGKYNNKPVINPAEVADWKYESITEIKKQINTSPALFAEWFKLLIGEVESYLTKNKVL